MPKDNELRELRSILEGEVRFDAHGRLRFNEYVLGAVVSLETIGGGRNQHRPNGAGWQWYVPDHAMMHTHNPAWPFSGQSCVSSYKIVRRGAAERACIEYVLRHVQFYGWVDTQK